MLLCVDAANPPPLPKPRDPPREGETGRGVDGFWFCFKKLVFFEGVFLFICVGD